MRINRSWGYEIIWAQTDKYIATTLHVDAGCAINVHEASDKTILVQYGRVQFENSKNKKILDMVPGDSLHIKPGMSYRIIACQNAEIIEVFIPQKSVLIIKDRKPKKDILNLSVGEAFKMFFNWLFRRKK